MNALIVDDHQITRIGLKVLIKELFPEAVVFEAEDGVGASKIAKKHELSLIVLDLNIPKTNTIELIKKFKIFYPDVKIIVVSMNHESIYAINVIRNGALGFVSKGDGYDQIKTAITRIWDNKIYLSDSLLTEYIATPHKMDLLPYPISKLTEREIEIAKLICEGIPTKSISDRAHLKPSTVSTYKNNIFLKLGVNNSIELFNLFKQNDML